VNGNNSSVQTRRASTCRRLKGHRCIPCDQVADASDCTDGDKTVWAGSSRQLAPGNGVLSLLFARGARQQGVQVVAIAHRGETDPALESEVDELHWVQLGQLGKMIDLFAARGVREAAMAGGIGKLRAFRHARPDLTALRVAASLRNFNDDGLLKAVAGAFEGEGIRIIASTEFLTEVLAAPGALTR
jgi:DUF1009 family protein